MNWADIEKVNKEIKTIDFKGKQYAEVKERVIAYRKLCPNGILNTELTFTDNCVMCTATATDNDGRLVAIGHARELLSKAFALENSETSAIGRCLGFMGLGISTSIASKEDMENSVSPSGLFDQPIINKKDLIIEFDTLFDKKKQAEILNGYGVLDVEDMDVDILKAYVTKKKNER